ncbi:MAG: hypothetical protein JJU45_12675 [Acidimicrobiia bacterium]|nr:hypothetical protein [Acidimicrobiia bacterium]
MTDERPPGPSDDLDETDVDPTASADDEPDDAAWSSFARGQEPSAEAEDTDHAEARPSGEGIEYELDAWARESRDMLRSLLLGANVPHAWEGGRLVVPEALEEAVDQLVEQVELTTLPTLDPDLEQVAFTVEDMVEAHLDRLQDALEEEGIAFEFNVDGELVVEAPTAERVEELLEVVEFPDALDLDDAGEGDDDDDDDDLVDIDAGDVLGGLFIAADRLARHPTDPEGVLGVAEGAETVEGARRPYGFDKDLWERIVGQSRGLGDLLRDDAATDDDIVEAAGSLRDLLRQYV